jgi:hypothetical protein
MIFYARKPEQYPVIKLFVEENFPNMHDVFDKTEHPEKLMLEYRAEMVKWYPEYENVQAMNTFITKFVELFDSEDSEIDGAYEYARIGEDIEDVETDMSGSADYFLGITRDFCIA